MDLLCFCPVLCLLCLCKPVLSGHTRRPNISFPDRLSLSEGFKYCRMLEGWHSAILLTFYVS